MRLEITLVTLTLGVGHLLAQTLPTGAMNLPRQAHTTTVLNSGLVLVTGGVISASTKTNTAELYNPATGTWRYTGIGQQSVMAYDRAEHTATKLNDGRVLIAAGGSSNFRTTSAEIFDPATETFTLTGSMQDPRNTHDAVLLNDGRVLVVGGYINDFADYGSAEIFSPATGTWTMSNNSLTYRAEVAIARLNDGRVLITGGGLKNRVDLFDPVANAWQTMTPLLYPRWTHTATTLSNGKVLIAGGNDGFAANYTAEVYDVSANGGTGGSTFVPGTLTVGGWESSAALLGNSNVLLAGGHNFVSFSCSSSTANIQLYDFGSGSLISQNPMSVPRTDFTATSLPSGQVLLAGGSNVQCGTTNILNSAELWGTAAPATGTINVTSSPTGAGFRLVGPGYNQLHTTPFTLTDVTQGDWTVTWSILLGGYQTPLPETKTLPSGQTIGFAGTYTAVTLGACPTDSPRCWPVLSFTFQQGTTGPVQPQLVNVFSNGPIIRFGAAATTNPAEGLWLTVNPPPTPLTPATISVDVISLKGLKAGSYSGQISVTSTEASNGPQVINVTLTVTKGPVARSPGLVFPVKGKQPYTVPISSVLDHDRSYDIIVAYTGERGRKFDGCDSGASCSTGGLDGFSSSPSGGAPAQDFLVNGNYKGGHYLNYEEVSSKTFTYQHPGYDYAVSGTVLAPTDGDLYIVGVSPKGQTKADPINGYHGVSSAWCGFHTFKIVHDDGTESWFLHTDHFLNTGEEGAEQDIGKLAQVALGAATYDPTQCEKTAVINDTFIRLTRVRAGEAIAAIGTWGAKGIHLHHEERNGKDCNSSGSNCLIDPFGWEGDGRDPLGSNPGIVMWSGYTRPSTSAAVIDSRTAQLHVSGINLLQGGSNTHIELWRKLDQNDKGTNPNDGTFFAELKDIQSQSSTDIVIQNIAPEIVADTSLYILKIGISDGPRSQALNLTIR